VLSDVLELDWFTITVCPSSALADPEHATVPRPAAANSPSIAMVFFMLPPWD